MTSSTINISWTASTDNVAVTGYEIFRDGSLYASVAGTSYADSGLPPLTSHAYQVRARDAAGNRSALTSPPVSATTTASPPDVIKITKAEWRASTKELKVEATSSGAPAAVLTVKGFGQMTYSASKKKYTFAKKPVSANPGTVTVTSSLGGSASASVTNR